MTTGTPPAVIESTPADLESAAATTS